MMTLHLAPNFMDDLRDISSQFLQLQQDRINDPQWQDLRQHQRRLEVLLAAACQCAVVEVEDDDVSVNATADGLVNRMVSFAYQDDGVHLDFLESFAHGDYGIIKDPESEIFGSRGPRAREAVIALIMRYADDPTGLASAPELRIDPYYATERPHGKTSLMARFQRGTPRSAITDATPSALAVFQGRFSMSSTRTCMPIQLSLPANYSHMALLQRGGDRQRDPLLTLFQCDVESEYHFCKEITIDTGLAGTAHHITGDAERNLFYVADDYRIKSFQHDSGNLPLPKHTLKSKNAGPVALVQNGSRILRAGKTDMDVWTVDSLPDHGPDGDELIGDGGILVDYSLRDDIDEIEPSTGTKPELTVTFVDSTIQPSIWSTFHDTQKLLVAPRDSYSCFSVDIETGCKITGRHIGHGGQVNGFSTSPADSNSFLTSCDDGIVRLFDIRGPLPNLSIDAGAQGEVIPSALYVHVDGLPVVITGGVRTEVIKMWDPRAKAFAYEIAAGNNAVISMAWDATRSTLFAATECKGMDRYGYHHGYRPAKITRRYDPYRPLKPWESGVQREGDDAELSGEEDDEDSDDFDDERYWPERAHHDETYFGYAFDAGEHFLFRYKFGVDTDPSVVPEYGRAAPRSDW